MIKIYKPAIIGVISLTILYITSCDEIQTVCLKVAQSACNVGDKVQLNSSSYDAGRFSGINTLNEPNAGTNHGSTEKNLKLLIRILKKLRLNCLLNIITQRKII